MKLDIGIIKGLVEYASQFDDRDAIIGRVVERVARAEAMNPASVMIDPISQRAGEFGLLISGDYTMLVSIDERGRVSSHS